MKRSPNTSRCGWLLAMAVVLFTPSAEPIADAQEAAGRSFAALRSQVPQQAAVSRVMEVQLHYPSAPQPLAIGTSRLTRLRASFERRSNLSRLPVERRPELAQDSLVVVLESRDGRELDWRIAIDPRISRAEAPGPHGELIGHEFRHEERALTLLVPDHPDATTLRVYSARWNGAEYVLDAAGVAALEGRP